MVKLFFDLLGNLFALVAAVMFICLLVWLLVFSARFLWMCLCVTLILLLSGLSALANLLTGSHAGVFEQTRSDMRQVSSSARQSMDRTSDEYLRQVYTYTRRR